MTKRKNNEDGENVKKKPAWTFVETERLIACVFTADTIWDPKSALHHNRNWVDKEWRMIAQQMQKDGE